MTAYCAITFTCKIRVHGAGKKIHQGHRGSISALDDLYPSQVKLPEDYLHIDESFEGQVEITSVVRRSEAHAFQAGMGVKLYEYPLMIAEGAIVSIDKMVDM